MTSPVRQLAWGGASGCHGESSSASGGTDHKQTPAARNLIDQFYLSDYTCYMYMCVMYKTIYDVLTPE